MMMMIENNIIHQIKTLKINLKLQQKYQHSITGGRYLAPLTIWSWVRSPAGAFDSQPVRMEKHLLGEVSPLNGSQLSRGD
jgi:hypothetical protein